MEKHVVIKEFIVGKTYKTKFSVPEDFLIKEIKLNRKGEPYYFNGIYLSNPELGICPLNADRLTPEKQVVETCSFIEYAKTLPVAEKICSLLKGSPKTHREWAERINEVGKVNRIIRNEEK